MEKENKNINIILHYLNKDIKIKCGSFENLKKIFLNKINNETTDDLELDILNKLDNYKFFIKGEYNPIEDESDFELLYDIEGKIKEIEVKNYKIKSKNNNININNNKNNNNNYNNNYNNIDKSYLEKLLYNLKEEIKTDILYNITENEKKQNEIIEKKFESVTKEISSIKSLIAKLFSNLNEVKKFIKNNEENLNNINNNTFLGNRSNNSFDFDNIKDLLKKEDINEISFKLNELENKIDKISNISNDNESNKINEIKNDLKKLINSNKTYNEKFNEINEKIDKNNQINNNEEISNLEEKINKSLSEIKNDLKNLKENDKNILNEKIDLSKLIKKLDDKINKQTNNNIKKKKNVENVENIEYFENPYEKTLKKNESSAKDDKKYFHQLFKGLKEELNEDE